MADCNDCKFFRKDVRLRREGWCYLEQWERGPILGKRVPLGEVAVGVGCKFLAPCKKETSTDG